MPQPRDPAGHHAEGPGAAAAGEGRAPDLRLEEERLSCRCVPRRYRPACCAGLETWLSVPAEAAAAGVVMTACGCCPPRRWPGGPRQPPRRVTVGVRRAQGAFCSRRARGGLGAQVQVVVPAEGGLQSGCHLHRVWSLLLWRHSSPAWTRCSLLWVTLLQQGVGWGIPRGPFRPLPCWDAGILCVCHTRRR